MTLGVKSGDSDLGPPEVYGPRGGIIGYGQGVDKGDELFMQLSRELSCSRLVRSLPRRAQTFRTWFLHRNSDLSYETPPVRSPTSVCQDPSSLVCTSTPHLGVIPLRPIFSAVS